MEPSSKKGRYEDLLSFLPAHAAHKVKQILENKKASHVSGAWKRKVKKVLEPSKDCYDQLQVPGADGKQPVLFYSGNVAAILSHVCSNSAFYLQRLRALQGVPRLSLLLSMDESTGGNVLATSSSLKMTLYYFTLREVGDIQRPSAWFPLCAIPSRDVSDALGGAGGITAAIVKHLVDQKLAAGVKVAEDLRLSMSLATYIGDYDSIRCIWSCKGSSALKPCVCCKNVLGKMSDVPSTDPYFLPLHSADVGSFDLIEDEELFSCYDSNLAEARDMSKEEKAETERTFGFVLSAGTLLSYPEARTMLPLSKLVLDAVHCYWANGVAAQELLLLMDVLNSRFCITLDQIQTSVGDVDWKSSKKDLSSASKRRHMFSAPMWKGDLYKGSATDTYYLVPLLLFYASELLPAEGCPELECFRALHEVPGRIFSQDFAWSCLNECC